MKSRGDVILINIHGGFPSSMIAKATRDLTTFRNLVGEAHVYSKVYPTNICSDCAFHDMVIDAPVGSMTDSSNHANWCFTSSTTKSIFSVFKQQGYSTRVFGIFGIDPKLNFHQSNGSYVIDQRKMLTEYGIDEFDELDGAFDDRPAHLQDREVLMRVCKYMSTRSDNPRFVMINLAGCRDAKRCEIAPRNDQNIIPIVKLTSAIVADTNRHSSPVAERDERAFSENVLDNPRDSRCGAHAIDAIRRSVCLEDYLKGQSNVEFDKHTVINAMVELQQFCWECLCKIDEGLESLMLTLKASDKYEKSVIYLYSDHAIGLYEHCTFEHVPWDACIRTFLIRKVANERVASYTDIPLSTNNIVPMLFRDCNILSTGWRVQRTLGPCCLTLGLALSWISRAMIEPRCDVFALRTFFIRALISRNGRRYAVIMWFSLHDLMCTTHGNVERSSEMRMTLCANTESWRNPVYYHTFHDLYTNEALQVFDHATDHVEMNNLCSSEWLKTEAAFELKEIINNELETHDLYRLCMKIPSNIFDLTIKNFTFDSLQRFPTTRLSSVECGCQTSGNATLNEVLLAERCPYMIIEALQSHLKLADSSFLTILVPVEPIHSVHKPFEIPPILIGAYTQHQLKLLAQLNGIVVDVVNNTKYTLDFQDERVVLQERTINLSSQRICHHRTGIVVLYVYAPLYATAPDTTEDTRSEILAPSKQSISLLKEVHVLSEEDNSPSKSETAPLAIPSNTKTLSRIVTKGTARTIESRRINGHRFDH